MLPAIGIVAGRDTAVRVLLGIPLPDRPVPQVLGIDDFALRRCHDYATGVIDADTGTRIDVLPGCGAAGREVAAHSTCWASATGLREGEVTETTVQRWQQIHDFLDAGVGLLDCSRRLGLALNTVKRYARAATPQRIQLVPKYRACLVDPYRNHLRARREQEPGMGATALLGEIRALGYSGSHNLLVRYLNQGRHLDKCPHLSPRRATRLILTRPENLTERQHERLQDLAAACPEMAALANVVRSFAALLTPHEGNPARMAAWAIAAHEADLPVRHPTCTPSPEASNRTSTPSPPRSPSTTTTDGPKA